MHINAFTSCAHIIMSLRHLSFSVCVRLLWIQFHISTSFFWLQRLSTSSPDSFQTWWWTNTTGETEADWGRNVQKYRHSTTTHYDTTFEYHETWDSTLYKLCGMSEEELLYPSSQRPPLSAYIYTVHVKGFISSLMSDSQRQSEVSFPVDRVSDTASEVVQIVFPFPAMPFFSVEREMSVWNWFCRENLDSHFFNESFFWLCMPFIG